MSKSNKRAKSTKDESETARLIRWRDLLADALKRSPETARIKAVADVILRLGVEARRLKNIEEARRSK